MMSIEANNKIDVFRMVCTDGRNWKREFYEHGSFQAFGSGVNGDGAPCPVVIYVNNSGALDYAPVDLIELVGA